MDRFAAGFLYGGCRRGERRVVRRRLVYQVGPQQGPAGRRSHERHAITPRLFRGRNLMFRSGGLQGKRSGRRQEHLIKEIIGPSFERGDSLLT
jgi:hypothetical protein